MRAASHTAATQPNAHTASEPAMLVHGTGDSPIRIGMMIGDEKGSHDNTVAVLPVGFTITEFTNSQLPMSRYITGIAACCASCSVFTIDPAAARSEA